MVLDYPDWSRVSSGSLRLLGVLTQTGVGDAINTWAIGPSERTVVALINAPLANTGTLAVVGSTTGFIAASVGLGSGNTNGTAVVAIAPVSSAIEPNWKVDLNMSAGTGTFTAYIFASTDSPAETAPGVNLPVTLALGSTRWIGPGVGFNSFPVVIATDTAAGRSGPNTGANSLPVVLATDNFPLGAGAHKPYDLMPTSTPAANAQAQVTFPAHAGQRWVIDYVDCVGFCGAAAAGSGSPAMSDSVNGAMWTDVLEVPSVANSRDRCGFGPNAGYVGSSGGTVTVTIPALGANVSGRINAGGYLLPAGL